MPQESRYAIVTGAGSGLGRALCLRLAADGWMVALCDVNQPAAEETLRLVEQAGGRGIVHPLDVTDSGQWEQLRDTLQSNWPRLDLLVNNAGIGQGGEMIDLDLGQWRRVLDVNLYGVIHGCQTFLPWLVENPKGAHLINTGSVAGLIAAPAMGPYNVSKAGVVALSESLYGELAGKKVGVTVVCPGFFKTNLLEEGAFTDEVFKKIGQRYMDNATFTADDIARLALKAMRKKQLYVVHNYRARNLWRLKRWNPGRFYRILAKVYYRSMRNASR